MSEPARWNALSGWALTGVLSFALAIVFFSASDGHWVPILDNANLAFHEFGHPFFGLFSARLAVYGGTLAQLAFPLIAAFDFRRRRHAASFALCLLWLFDNLLNIAVYMADARARLLPLVGGRDPEEGHDWAEIFSRWTLLASDTRIAGLVSFAAYLGIAACCAWLYTCYRRSDPSSRAR